MMKRMGLLLVALALCAGSTVMAYNPYAPNPFAAIERHSWEYTYARDLTKAGLTGADMSKFSPAYELSRVELRDMIATALQNRARATTVQQKEIDKLAEEYADDLTYTDKANTVTKEEPAGIPFDWRQGTNDSNTKVSD
ncbi:hypothetical protein [Megasphaera hominis]|jgi:hypothetical protein|nr:hypothetical protein [Megasphaera hominis]